MQVFYRFPLLSVPQQRRSWPLLGSYVSIASQPEECTRTPFPASNVIPASKPSVLRQSLADGKLILTLFPPDPERKTGWHRRTIRKPRRAGGGFGSHSPLS